MRSLEYDYVKACAVKLFKTVQSDKDKQRESKINKQQSIIDSLTEVNTNYGVKVADLESKLQRKSELYDDLRSDYNELNQQLNKQAVDYEEKIYKLEEDNKSLHTSVDTLNSTVSYLSSQLSTVLEIVTVLKTEMREISKSLSSYSSESSTWDDFYIDRVKRRKRVKDDSVLDDKNPFA